MSERRCPKQGGRQSSKFKFFLAIITLLLQIGSYTIALCAQALHKPLYIAVESFKIATIYPLNNRLLPVQYIVSLNKFTYMVSLMTILNYVWNNCGCTRNSFSVQSHKERSKSRYRTGAPRIGLCPSLSDHLFCHRSWQIHLKRNPKAANRSSCLKMSAIYNLSTFGIISISQLQGLVLPSTAYNYLFFN